MGRSLEDGTMEWQRPAQKRCSLKCRLMRLTYVLGFVAIAHYLYQWGLFGALSGRIMTSTSKLSNKNVSTCTSAACIHASSSILYNLSPNHKDLDPCDDFEEYVCGGWREQHDLRPDQGSAFTGTFMAEQSQTLLRHILESPYPKNSMHSHFSPMNLGATEKSADERNYDKMKAAYGSCMDLDAIKKVGDAPLLDFLSTFDVTKSANVAARDLEVQGTIRWLSYHGIAALVSLYAGADDTDPDSVVISISSPRSIGLPSKERYADDGLVSKYGDVLKKVLSLLYPGKSIAEKGDLIVEFEKKLAAASPDEEERESVEKYYNPMSLDEASALCPQIDLANMVKNYANQTGTVVNRVIVAWPSYLKDLSKILDETDAETIQGYLVWKSVQSLSSYVESESVTPYQRFAKELAGQDPDAIPERWRTCVRYVDGSLGWILSRFFIEKAFSAAAKELGDRMIYDIKDQFISVLESTTWMEESVRELAIKKVKNIIQKIGYPTKSPNIMDPPSLEKYYEDLNIVSSSYFNNTMLARVFDTKMMWDTLGKPVDREQWGMTASTVNAYYNPPGSEIVFPAGIMQFPVFDVEFPEYLSYGAFASVAGHELSHAFDSTGRHYDETGNYTDWWTEETVKEFQKRAQCFVDQYSNFTIVGPDGNPVHVNGRLTLGENIADSGGVNAAFVAWQKRAAEKPNQNLPGLEEFTQEQLFHVNYAQWWCGKTTPQQALNWIYTDPHSPVRARVLGTMANAKSFRESFNCPVKKPTCKLW